MISLSKVTENILKKAVTQETCLARNRIYLGINNDLSISLLTLCTYV